MKSSYQEQHFLQIADAIRYVWETDEQIPAVDFYKWIRALKSMTGGGGGITGNCRLGDNIPDGCGEDHGLLHLDYTLVNCVTEKLIDFKMALAGMCLCDDHWGYGPPACGGLHGLLHLDYDPIEPPFQSSVVWGEIYAS